MLGKTGDKQALNDWKAKVGEAEAARVSKFATDRGSKIHAYVEAYLKLDAKDEASIDNWACAAYDVMKDGGQTEEMAYRLRQEVRSHVGTIYCQEVPLWSPTLKVAGAVDYIGEWDGELAAADWKTSKQPKQKKWIDDYFIQVAFYARSHNELFGTDIDKIVVAITCETGEPQVFEESARKWNAKLEERIDAYYEIQAENYLASLAA